MSEPERAWVPDQAGTGLLYMVFGNLAGGIHPSPDGLAKKRAWVYVSGEQLLPVEQRRPLVLGEFYSEVLAKVLVEGTYAARALEVAEALLDEPPPGDPVPPPHTRMGAWPETPNQPRPTR